jgi:hypothetical protein
MNTASKRAQKIAGNALEQAARSGVARALAARENAGVDLTAGDLAQVSGGGFAVQGIRAGGIPALMAINPAANPAINPAPPAVQGFATPGLAV